MRELLKPYNTIVIFSSAECCLPLVTRVNNGPKYPCEEIALRDQSRTSLNRLASQAAVQLPIPRPPVFGEGYIQTADAKAINFKE